MGSDSSYDYKALGLKVGIEIHQQLNSAHKLFCDCPNRLQGTREPDYTILRKHRPVLGETGKFDEAMLVEFTKGSSVIYEGFYDCTCTYELDETPPFKCDEEAIDIALEICHLFKMNIIREMHVCRKNYVDGSVPAGFQRTMEIGTQGELELKSGKVIGIENIFLEEDAARRTKNDTKNKLTYFRVDRLGIPLVEITTTPEIYDPMEARDAAYRIGLLLRSTGKVKKVLGSIRQDINVSIKEGNRIEIKGVQKLDWIPELVKYEVQRQLALIEIKKELEKRNVKPDLIEPELIDVSKIFKKTACKFVAKGLKNKLKLYALKIPKFSGLYGRIIQPNRRFGTEVASKVKVLVGLKGLIHSDEDLINKYEFSTEEIEFVQNKLKCEKSDLFILLLAKKDQAEHALRVITDRTKAAFNGVPAETRQANDDGTHEFLRELSGGSRLYPDTDLQAIPLSQERIDKIRESVGPYPWDVIGDYAEKYKLPKDTIESLIMAGQIKLFERLIKKSPEQSQLIVTLITDKVKVLSRAGKDIENLNAKHFEQLLDALNSKKIAKEAIDKVLELWCEKPELEFTNAKKEAGISDFDITKLEPIIKELIEKNQDLIERKGRGAIGPLMGDLMKIVGRGAVDGKILSKKLSAAIQSKIGNAAPNNKKDKKKKEQKEKKEKNKNQKHQKGGKK